MFWDTRDFCIKLLKLNQQERRIQTLNDLANDDDGFVALKRAAEDIGMEIQRKG